MPPFFTTILIPMLLAALERFARVIEDSPATTAAALRAAVARLNDPDNFSAFAEGVLAGFNSGMAQPSADGRSTKSAEPGTVAALDLGLGATPPLPPAAADVPINTFDMQATIDAAVAAALARRVTASGPPALVQPGAPRGPRPMPAPPKGSNA